jgi:ribosomal protein S18 acetylase RimI-like enzyme
MKIQHQIWGENTRDLIMTEGGTVQLGIYKEPISDIFPCRAYISCLWVDEEYRRQGIATRLMKCAEQLARNAGIDRVYLDFKEDDTPVEILEWYIRNGYEEIAEHSDGSYTLQKILL